jgi:hypothetical protein
MDANSPTRVSLGVIKIIFDYIKAKHPLAASMPRESSLLLCKKLNVRLNVNETELDFSPNSLKKLETLLSNYHANNAKDIGDEETVMLVRELAAYIGEVLIRNTDGQWVLLNETIWGTRIEYEGKWKLLKENKKRFVSAVSYTLADIAASSWQKILDGKPLRIYQYFNEIQKKEMKETLTYK